MWVRLLLAQKRFIKVIKRLAIKLKRGHLLKAREGDLIKSKSSVVFDVKGLVHPAGKVVAFPRFIPAPQGIRQDKDTTYAKVYSLGDRFKYLQDNYPELIIFDQVFGETMCEVPEAEVAVHYQPEEKLWSMRNSKDLTILEHKALQLAETLKAEAGIPWSSIGISGSIMAGLTTEKSDIDPLVYGAENCRKAYAALQRLLQKPDSGFKPYSRDELGELFDFRSKDTQMTFDDFVMVESRKAFQGKFMGTDYFVRFVRDWPEICDHYGDVCYTNSGYAKIRAKISDDVDSLFTPCTYRLSDVEVVQGPKLAPIEVVSFRGRFCEQATKGETVEAQGKVELVTEQKTGSEHYRLILGGKPQDYMVLKN
jgi:predicted nucleotidyltransferase